MIHEYVESNEIRKYRIYAGIALSMPSIIPAGLLLTLFNMTVGLQPYMIVLVILVFGVIGFIIFKKVSMIRLTIQLFQDEIVVLDRGLLKRRHSLHEPFEFADIQGGRMTLGGHSIKANGKLIVFIPGFAIEDYIMLKSEILKQQANSYRLN